MYPIQNFKGNRLRGIWDRQGSFLAKNISHAHTNAFLPAKEISLLEHNYSIPMKGSDSQ